MLLYIDSKALISKGLTKSLVRNTLAVSVSLMMASQCEAGVRSSRIRDEAGYLVALTKHWYIIGITETHSTEKTHDY